MTQSNFLSQIDQISDHFFHLMSEKTKNSIEEERQFLIHCIRPNQQAEDRILSISLYEYILFDLIETTSISKEIIQNIYGIFAEIYNKDYTCNSTLQDLETLIRIIIFAFVGKKDQILQENTQKIMRIMDQIIVDKKSIENYNELLDYMDLIVLSYTLLFCRENIETRDIINNKINTVLQLKQSTLLNPKIFTSIIIPILTLIQSNEGIIYYEDTIEIKQLLKSSIVSEYFPAFAYFVLHRMQYFLHMNWMKDS